MNAYRNLLAAASCLTCSLSYSAEPTPAPKPASAVTAQANAEVARQFNLADRQDFLDAQRGLIARLPDNVIKNVKGDVVWNGAQFDFIQGVAPATVNPSLWRQEQLNNFVGLFKVTDGIWQIRGYDIANMTLIAGKTGWIVIDPLLSEEVAKTTLDFAMERLGRKPIVAVIYTHSHADHFGGVHGVANEADVRAGKLAIIAPAGFMEHAVAENVLAGNAMSRRAQYQFGAPLAFGERAAVGSGLGKALSFGAVGVIPPTDIIQTTGEERVIDGVRIVFQMANGSEAPAEFALYFPDMKALCLSEIVTANLHNIYTLRGAQMRDALSWSKYINQMLDLFPDAQAAFRSHHWPVWDNARIRRHLTHQRDAYRYIHDAALHLANSGMTMDEIGDHTYFPKALADDFSTHGYYGTLSHNLRGVYAFYLGFYDGNPATLHRLPPTERAQRYIAAMGGAKAAFTKAEKAFKDGDYRWAAELNNHLVFAEPTNRKAQLLQADILEQLGYRAESGVWRNEYLTAAKELREGVKVTRTNTQGAAMIRGMTMEMIFDLVAVRLDHRQADGHDVGVNIHFTDSNEHFALELSNGVLNNTKGRRLAAPNASLSLTQAALIKLLVAQTPLAQLAQQGEAQVTGDAQALRAIFGNVKTFDPQFNIVTP